MDKSYDLYKSSYLVSGIKIDDFKSGEYYIIDPTNVICFQNVEIYRGPRWRWPKKNDNEFEQNEKIVITEIQQVIDDEQCKCHIIQICEIVVLCQSQSLELC